MFFPPNSHRLISFTAIHRETPAIVLGDYIKIRYILSSFPLFKEMKTIKKQTSIRTLALFGLLISFSYNIIIKKKRETIGFRYRSITNAS